MKMNRPYKLRAGQHVRHVVFGDLVVMKNGNVKNYYHLKDLKRSDLILYTHRSRIEVISHRRIN